MKKILLADDDALILLLYQNALKNAGYEVITASNGQQALGLIATSPPDLIVLDIVMPVMDGFTMLRELKKISLPRAPVIVITGNQKEYEAAREEARLAGAAAFLTKPFSPAQLLAVVQHHLPK